MVESKIKQDEEIAKELALHIGQGLGVSPMAKAAACSCVVDVLCHKGKADEAFEYLKSSLEHFPINEFPRVSMLVLKEALEKENKKFPYEIPPPRLRRSGGGRRQAVESDSDSD